MRRLWSWTPKSPAKPHRNPSSRHTGRRSRRSRQRIPRLLRTQGIPLVVQLPPIDIKLDWAQRLTAIGTVISSLSVLALGAGLYYSNQDNRAQRQLQYQAQVSDRLAKDVEQLGSTQLATTLGGIYGLERLMRDSPADQGTVVEILAAYVRDTSQKRKQQAPPTGPGASSWLASPPSTQLQAALTVLGRQPCGGYRPPDLDRADLSGADLRLVFLPRVELYGAHLVGADLTAANLYGADLVGADMRATHLSNTDLSFASMDRVNLNGANLYGQGPDLRFLNPVGVGNQWEPGANFIDANLVGASLNGVDLPRSSFTWADLENVDMRNAELVGADLVGANLHGALLGKAGLRGTNSQGPSRQDVGGPIRCSRL